MGEDPMVRRLWHRYARRKYESTQCLILPSFIIILVALQIRIVAMYGNTRWMVVFMVCTFLLTFGTTVALIVCLISGESGTCAIPLCLSLWLKDFSVSRVLSSSPWRPLHLRPSEPS